MSKLKETTWIYGRDGTMPNNNDDYGSASTATLEKFPGVTPYVFKPIVQTLPHTEPTQASSEVKPVPTDSTREDDRGKLVEDCLRRAKEYMAKNDPMQASEKLYKTTEEAIKFLAEYHNLSEFEEAKTQGQWWNKLLGRSAKSLSRLPKRKGIDEAWARAYDIHMLGFHENAYSVEDIKPAVPLIEKIVTYVKEANDARRKANP